MNWNTNFSKKKQRLRIPSLSRSGDSSAQRTKYQVSNWDNLPITRLNGSLQSLHHPGAAAEL